MDTIIDQPAFRVTKIKNSPSTLGTILLLNLGLEFQSW